MLLSRFDRVEIKVSLKSVIDRTKTTHRLSTLWQEIPKSRGKSRYKGLASPMNMLGSNWFGSCFFFKFKEENMKIAGIIGWAMLAASTVYTFSPDKEKNGPMGKPVTTADGPYVTYKDGFVHTRYIVKNGNRLEVEADSMELTHKGNLQLNVPTDVPGKTFAVKLKSKLENERAKYSNPRKLFVVSDMEGSFGAFRKLLQAHGIIDENLQWSYGDGHLVLIGDFVDRGDRVTELLWLIYALEGQASDKGGYVHFILGNHEIMNMNGDLRYLHKKYVENAMLLNEQYVLLYGENSELGRWFRTKNVAEKIGDILFVHGGISDLVARQDIPVPQINKLVRPYYSDSTYNFTDPLVGLLYSDYGPFWYRGYYYPSTGVTEAQLDSTLDKYDVRHIATGHTVIADTIAVLYGGRLFNTDVRHANGTSEALLRESGKYYRVNARGERFLLMGGKKRM